MTFVSYAQNFEDILLWRVLKDIKHGFYIDIGAQDPIIDSVSLAFYKNGWRGVHVEPTPQYAARLEKERPDEIVERLAIGPSEGWMTFYQIPDTGLSTADSIVAERHREAGFSIVETQVAVLGLDALLDRYEYKIVHWLKIDVEGFEKQVIESWKVSPIRPWLLLIESTMPGSQVETHEPWEYLVLEKGYQYAYFDGINRYYVHESRSGLLDHFKAPVNIFDGALLSGTASQPYCVLLNGKLQELGNERDNLRSTSEHQAAELIETRSIIEKMHAEVSLLSSRASVVEAAKTQLANIQHELDQVRHEKAILSERLNDSLANSHHWWEQAMHAQEKVLVLHNSTSWRVTAPLRLASYTFQRIYRAVLPALPVFIRRCIRVCIRPLLRYPGFVRRLNVLVARYPRLAKALRGDRQAAGLESVRVMDPITSSPMPADIHELSARSKKLYASFFKRDMENRT